MIDAWSFLEISPTNDVSAIKKAYAQKLRIHHPEDDPQGYQQLREAYDRALKYAKRMAEDQSRPISIPGIARPMTSFDIDSPNISVPTDIPVPDDPGIEQLNNHFMNKVESLYNDFFARINIDNWDALLNDDVIWIVENQETISNMMLDFLCSHHFLPQDIWMLLDSYFNWCDEIDTIHWQYRESFVKYIHQQITQPQPLSYMHFKPMEGVDYESYLENREEAQLALFQNDLPSGKIYVECAREIYGDDPELTRLEGIICLRNGEADLAVQLFNKVLGINPNDLNAVLYRGVINYENERYQPALDDFQRILSRQPNYREIVFLIANSYLSICAYEKAKEWALKALKMKSSVDEAKALLAQIHALSIGQLTGEPDPANRKLIEDKAPRWLKGMKSFGGLLLISVVLFLIVFSMVVYNIEPPKYSGMAVVFLVVLARAIFTNR